MSLEQTVYEVDYRHEDGYLEERPEVRPKQGDYYDGQDDQKYVHPWLARPSVSARYVTMRHDILV